MRKIIISILFLILSPSLLFAYSTPDGVCGFTSSHTVQVKQYNLSDSVLDLAYTATGVTEQAGISKSCYIYNFSLIGGKGYMLCMKDVTASPNKEQCWTVTSYQTSIDALTSSRLPSSGGTVANVTNPVTVGTNNDKGGYTVATVQDKVGYTLSQSFPANFASMQISSGGGVTAGTVTDKGGYSLSIPSPTAAQIATQVWQDGTAYGVGTKGYLLGSAASAGDPWATLIPGVYPLGSAGNIVGSLLDASISSRLAGSSYVAPDNSDVQTILGRFTSQRALYLDNLAGLTTTRTTYLDNLLYWTMSRAAYVDNLQYLTSTRSVYLDNLQYLTPARAMYLDNIAGGAVLTASAFNTKVPTAFTYTNSKPDVNVVSKANIDFSTTEKSFITTAFNADYDQIAQYVWNYTFSGCQSSSACEKLQAAANAGDPWAASWPGGYGENTAGNFFYNNIASTTLKVNTLPTLAEIENTGVLVKRTPGSPTNMVALTSDNSIQANASVALTDQQLLDLGRQISSYVSAGATPQEIWQYVNRSLTAPPFVLPVMQGRVYSTFVTQNEKVPVKTGDTPTFNFDLGKDLTGWTIMFAARTYPTATSYIIQPKSGSWINASKGQGSVTLSATDTQTAGLLYGEIKLYNGSQSLTGIEYQIDIQQSIIR